MDFRISFRRNAPNPLGILRSKSHLKIFLKLFYNQIFVVKLHFMFILTATGEPPLCMSCTIPIAIRYALNSARADAGNKDPWYQLG